MIELKNLSKTFENNKQALKNVNLTIQKNSITGLIGFNGSGKTTTFNILVDFIEKHKGKVFIDGKKPNLEIIRSISYLAAGSEPRNKTRVSSHLMTIGQMHGGKKADIKNIINKYAQLFELDNQLNNQIRSLSKGNQQKIKLIAVFLNPKAKYIFLDEPFDGLDPIMVKKVQKVFMGLKNKTIVITSHRMDVVQDMVSEFYVLKEGVLVDSKKISDKEIVLRVNKEVSVTEAKKLKEVVKVNIGKDYYELVIKDIKDFKKVNVLLIKSKDYLYSSYIEKNLAESVFNQYGEEENNE